MGTSTPFSTQFNFTDQRAVKKCDMGLGLHLSLVTLVWVDHEACRVTLVIGQSDHLIWNHNSVAPHVGCKLNRVGFTRVTCSKG